MKALWTSMELHFVREGLQGEKRREERKEEETLGEKETVSETERKPIIDKKE